MNACSSQVLDGSAHSDDIADGLPVLSGSTTDQLQGEFLVWYSLTEKSTEVIDKAIATYQKIQPNVKVVAESIDAEEFVPRLLKDYRRGLGPNMILIDYFWTLNLIDANALLPLNDKEFKLDDLLPAALTQITYGDRVYSFPVALLTQVLCYNKNKVDVDNLPKTLDDLMTQAILGYSVGIPSSFVDTFWGLQIFGGKLFDASGNVTFDADSWAAWLTWLQQAKSQPNVILDLYTPALKKAFAENRLAYLVCDSTMIPSLRKELGAENFGITLLPQGDKGKAGPLLYARVLSLVQGGSFQQTKIALDFARFITNSQQAKKRLIELGSIILPDRNINLDTRLFPIEGVLIEQSKTGVAIPLNYVRQTYAIFTTAETLYQQVMEGAIAPKDAGVKLLELVKQNFKTTP